jgi:predicted ArsR family transcriptional regulator
MIKPAPNLRRRVFEFVHERGGHGATAEEIEVGLELSGNTVRPRLVELRELGAVVKTDSKRKTRSGRQAVVYVAVEGTP